MTMTTQPLLFDPGTPAPRQPRGRRALDRYLTPCWATKALIERAPQVRGGVVFDPSSGDGRMAAALVEAGRFTRAVRNDLDPAAPAELHEDATRPALWAAAGDFDYVVTNPPFVHASAIIWLALQHARRGVAMHVRSTWLEPCQDRLWLEHTPPTRELRLPRISYDGSGGSDSASPCWYLWERGEDGAWKRGTIEVVTRGSVGQEPLALGDGR